MDFLKMAPMRFLLLITGAWLVVFLLTRTVLLLAHLDESGGGTLSVFGIGLLYDWASSPMQSCRWACTYCFALRPCGAVAAIVGFFKDC